MSDVTIPAIDKDALIAQLQAALAARDTLIDTLRVQLAQLRRQTFGQSSEKLALQIEQLELSLEELEGEATLADIGKAVAEPSQRQPAVRSLPEHLPREERRIEPECGSCTCPDCGGDLRPLGQDSDEMLDALPVQWRVIRHVRPRCLVPAFDGALSIQLWKEAIWDKFVMGAPRPRTLSEQQYSDRKLRSRR